MWVSEGWQPPAAAHWTEEGVWWRHPQSFQFHKLRSSSMNYPRCFKPCKRLSGFKLWWMFPISLPVEKRDESLLIERPLATWFWILSLQSKRSSLCADFFLLLVSEVFSLSFCSFICLFCGINWESFFCGFWDRISYSSGWHWALSVDENDLELLILLSLFCGGECYIWNSGFHAR